MRNSVEAIFMLKPDGQWATLTPEDPLFEQVFDSEGQIGVVVGVSLKVKPQTYKSKPYAFSFTNPNHVRDFLKLVREWELQPTSILYFDQGYIKTTHEIAKKKAQKSLEKSGCQR
ncbi:MAG: hypothetical protein R3C26_02550 [Calditrichia bacterium]